MSPYRIQNVGWIEGRLYRELKFSSKNKSLFKDLVEQRGIEPLTSAVRSPSKGFHGGTGCYRK